MRILITGATGLIGYHLVNYLIEDDTTTVYAVGRDLNRLKSTFVEISDKPNLRLCEYGKTLSHLEDVGHIDIIYHLAGPTSPDDIKNRPVDVIQPNVVGLNAILDYAAHEKWNGYNCRVIVSSSVTVYQNNTNDDIVVSEEDSYSSNIAGDTSLCYSESKRFAEMLAHSYQKQHGVDVIIVRIGYVYGYTKNIPHTTLFDFMNSAIFGEKIEIRNASLPRRDNIYIDDVIRGLLKAAMSAQSGEVINISSNGEKGNFASLDEMASIICEAVYEDKNEIATKLIIPEISKRKSGVCADNSKLQQYGWVLGYSLEDGIKKMIADIHNEK